MDRLCKKCGAVLDEDALFCTVCGTKYTQEPEKRFCGHCGNELGGEGCLLQEMRNCGTKGKVTAGTSAPPLNTGQAC